MERAMARDNIAINDRQLACARIGSVEGQEYLVGIRDAPSYLARHSRALPSPRWLAPRITRG